LFFLFRFAVLPADFFLWKIFYYFEIPFVRVRVCPFENFLVTDCDVRWALSGRFYRYRPDQSSGPLSGPRITTMMAILCLCVSLFYLRACVCYFLDYFYFSPP
jgi:hypothetical protein